MVEMNGSHCSRGVGVEIASCNLSMHYNFVALTVLLFLCSVDLNAADTGVQLKTTVVTADRKPGSAEAKREGQCNC